MHERTLTRYSLTHLGDAVLVRELAVLVAHDRVNTAMLLAHVGEVDARRLYVTAGHPSMFAYCVDELHFSEDAAYKRIRAARAARRLPILFDAVAEGRLHLAAVYLIASHVTPENVEDLVDAATHRTKAEIEEWLGERFPSPHLPLPPTRVRALPVTMPPSTADRDRVEEPSLPLFAARSQGNLDSDCQRILAAIQDDEGDGQPGTGPVQDGTRVSRGQLALGPVHGGSGGGQLAPGPDGGNANGSHDRTPAPEPQRFLIQVTVDKATHDKLRRAQALLSHAVPAGDVAQVLGRALDALIANLEKRKIGAGHDLRLRRPTNGEHSSQDSQAVRSNAGARFGRRRRRYIPVSIRRAVWERDQGQCTYISPARHRCTARRFLEFDHVQPVARGGKATVEGLRLRCRAHNQLEAERAFGAGFMDRKREEARSTRNLASAQPGGLGNEAGRAGNEPGGLGNEAGIASSTTTSGGAACPPSTGGAPSGRGATSGPDLVRNNSPP